MIGLFGPFPSEPIATIPPELRSSTADTFASLLDDPDFQPILVMKALPFNPSASRTVAGTGPIGVARQWPWRPDSLQVAGGGEDTVYLSDKGFTTSPDDSPPNTIIEARLNPAYQFSIRLFDGVEPSGEGKSSIGDIVIQNNDGGVDAFADYGWDGRSIQILAGVEGLPFDQFGLVLQGTIESLSWNDRQIRLSLRESGLKFEQPLNRSRYDGTGDENGDSDLKDVYRPYCAGQVRNVPPTLVEASSLLYQVNDGPISSIDDVRDRGVSLTNAGDFASVTALLAASTGAAGSGADIEAGEYGTSLSDGYFRLGGQSTGQVTSDVKGDNDGGYVNDAASIVRRIVENRIGILSLDSTEIDGGTFNALSSAQDAVIGFWVKNEEVSVRDVITLILAKIGGWWFFNRRGKLEVGRLEAPSGPALRFTENDILRIARLNYPPPSWRRNVGYKRMWTVQGDEDLAASVSDANRQLFRSEYRFEADDDSSIRNRHRLARDSETLTLFDESTDAASEATRLLNLHGEQRDFYRAVVKRAQFRVYAGDVIEITYPRWDLTGGKNFTVIGFSETAEQIELELWG